MFQKDPDLQLYEPLEFKYITYLQCYNDNSLNFYTFVAK